jgi:hypothetical protein
MSSSVARSNCSPGARLHDPGHVELVRAGLASASAERVVAGAQRFEVVRVRIRDAERKVLVQSGGLT